MTDLGAVASILAEYPEIGFDLETYLLATKQTGWLEEQFASFQCYIAGGLPPPDHESRIVDSLRQSLARVVPAYEGLGEVREFRDIPFCDETALRRAPRSFVRQDIPQSDLWRLRTSGTTGPPKTLFYSARFFFDYVYLTLRKGAYVAGQRAIPARPAFGVVLDNTDDGGEFVDADPTGHVGPALRLHVKESDGATIARVFRLLETLRPAVIATMPSIFEALIAYDATMPTAVRVAPLCVISAGSFLGEAARRETEMLWGAPVFISYGLSEFGLVASECREQDGLHVDQTAVLVEVIDPDGQPITGEREGELVLSSLANSAMPLLRYRTGDVGALSSIPCPCGHPGPRIMGIRGRQVSYYRFASGAPLHPARFNSLFWLFPVVEFQIVQTSLERLEVWLEPSATEELTDDLTRRIASHIQSMLPCPVDVQVRATRFERGHKFERHLTQVKGRTPSRGMD